jgi:hypothetical protein
MTTRAAERGVADTDRVAEQSDGDHRDRDAAVGARE